jgi:hypothetical protein
MPTHKNARMRILLPASSTPVNVDATEVLDEIVQRIRQEGVSQSATQGGYVFEDL